MKRLYLMRHASPEAGPPGDDAARALTPGGRAEARRIGASLRELAGSSPCVRVSTARRARETFDELGRGFGGPLAGEIDPALYLASADRLLAIIEGQDDHDAELLLIGHNPGLARLAYELLRSSEEEARETIARDFGPATLVALTFETEQWSSIDRGLGHAPTILRPAT